MDGLVTSAVRRLSAFAVAVGLLAPGCSRPAEIRSADVLAAYRDDAEYGGLTIEYPLDGALFPPEIAAPTFRWHDESAAVDTWLVTIGFADGGDRVSSVLHAAEWTPPEAQWAEIKRRSLEQDATVAVLGVRRAAPGKIVSGARVTLRTSRDEVGAPLFYREVNLPFIEAVRDPSRIRWRYGPVSAQEPPPIVLTDLPVCGNCHSFSADGARLGMDVDYANDKGSYVFTPVRHEIDLATSDMLTWSDFRREDGQATFGLLSQVSPDGRYAVSTVKDRSVFVDRPDRAFSQLFFPIQGILAVYDRAAQTFRALPGADDPEYVQSNPAWSPDGQTIVFARSRAHKLKNDTGHVLLTAEQCGEFLVEGKTFLFDLYRIPFSGGAGGTPEPLAGASQDGMSNFFAKFSPDGRWIVFCRARSFMLLQPDSELYIIPAGGGEARRLRCNTGRMNSWHTWSPNGKWLVFSSKAQSDFTQLWLTHIDEDGESTPPVVLDRLTAPDRAANIPEFVNAAPDAIAHIRPQFIDDVSYVRAGDAFLRAGGDTGGAIRQFRKALELNPRNAVAHSNLGGVLVTLGQNDEGVKHLDEAVRLDPTNGGPYYNLGMLYSRQGKVDEAIAQLTLAVRYRPEVADAQRVLGALLCGKGAAADALPHLAAAVRLSPRDAVAHYWLGKALALTGRVDEAVQHLTLAVQLDPRDVDALAVLGRMLFTVGRAAEAIDCLSRAVQIKPDDVPLLADLAGMLAMPPDPALRNTKLAVELARRACALTDNQAAPLLDLLAAAEAADGRFAEAIQTAERALALLRAAGQDTTAIQRRIELYRQGRTFELPGRGTP